MPRPGTNCRQRIGNSIACIIMRMDAKVRSWNMLRDLGDNKLDLMRERSAIGIAKDNEAGPARVGRLCAGKRIIAVGFVPIKKMLAIDDHLPASATRRCDRLANIFEILFERAA